jgi:hypothetical protein
MNKKIAGILLVMAALIATPLAFSQMEQAQPVIYTYVSEFQVPRANWVQYAENAEKTFVPIAEKMVANGTIVSYSTFETVVHTPEGYTNGAAWSSTTISGLMKVLDEVRKGGPQAPQVAATKHEDLLMQSSMYLSGTGGAPAYFRVICQNAKPEKPEGYAAVIKKYIWPVAEEQAKQGVINFISLDSQYVNTGAPSTRCLVIDYPNAEAMDKWAAAVNATLAKMSAADREAFYGAPVADSRRDFMFRVTHFGVAHK